MMPKEERSFTEIIIAIFGTERKTSKRSKKIKEPESFDEKIVNGIREFLESPF
jgi:hypothetical protein